MVWSSNLPNGGFTTGKPWLPVPDIHRAMAVNTQQGRDGSIFEFYRDFLEFRRANPALIKGDISFVDTPDDVVAYIRDDGETKILCAFNLGHGPAEFGTGLKLTRLDAPLDGQAGEDGVVKLKALGGYIGRVG